MTVLAAIRQRQSEVLKEEALELDAVRARVSETRRRVDAMQHELDVMRATSNQRMAEWDIRIEKVVSGFGAFLGQVTGEKKSQK
jgi:hypothetical protein